MIEFYCPKCGKHFRVLDKDAGRHGWCKGCGAIMRVPHSTARASDALETDTKLNARVEALVRQMVAKLKEERQLFNDVNRKYEEAQARAQRADELQLAVVAAAAERDRLATLVERATRERDALDEENRALSSLLATSRHEPEGVCDAESSSEIASEQTAEREARLLEENRRLEWELEAERDARRDTELRLAEAECRLTRLTAGIEGTDVLRARAEDAESRADALRAELDATNRRMAEEKDFREGLRETITGLTTDADMVREQLAARLREVENLRLRVRELEPAEHEAKAALARLGEREQVIDRLTAELSAAATGHGEARARAELSQAELDSLRARLNDASESSDTFLAELEAETALMRCELEAERGARREAEGALAEAREQMERLRSQIDELREEFRESVSATRDASSLQLELEAATVRLQEKEGLVEKLTAEFAAIAGQLGQADTRAEFSAKEIERLSQALSAEQEAKVAAENRADEAVRQVDQEPGRTWRLAPLPVSSRERTEGITLIPEVVDDNDQDSEMFNTLIRFLEPE